MRLWPPLAVLLLAACATAPVPEKTYLTTVPILEERPARPYEVLERIEVRGVPGEHVRLVYEELRDKARQLGADAVVLLEQEERLEGTPAPWIPLQRPLIGNAYPGPFYSLSPNALPPGGIDLRSRGVYYVVAGLAIRYEK